MAKTFANFIAGKWVAPAAGNYFEDRNPARTKDLIGRFPDSDQQDVSRAVRSANQAQAAWAATPPPARGEILKRVGDISPSGKKRSPRR